MLVAFALGMLAAADPGQALLDAAERSTDPATRQRLLRGWATLGGSPDAPGPMAIEAHAALTFAMDAGRFRLFASRQGDRLKLGLHDPAGVVSQLDVHAEIAGQPLILPRAESDEPGRLDYKIDPSVPASAILVVRALARGPNGEIELRAIRLEPHDALPLPAAPDPNAPPPLIRQRRGEAETADAGAVVPWWWLAVGAVAAGMVGAAIWQETRR